MSATMCQHGFTFGKCPYGCRPTTGVIEPTIHDNVIGEGLPPAPETGELSCVICGQTIKEGSIYKGKPLCSECREGMKGEK